MSTSRHGQSTRQCNIYSQVSQSAVRHSRPKYHRNNRRISAQCPPHSQTQEMRHLLACSSADTLFFTNKRPTMDRQTTYSSIHKSLVSKRIQYNKDYKNAPAVCFHWLLHGTTNHITLKAALRLLQETRNPEQRRNVFDLWPSAARLYMPDCSGVCWSACWLGLIDWFNVTLNTL